METELVVDSIKILSILTERNLTVNWLAGEVGQHPNTMYQTLSSGRTTLRSISAIARALGENPKELVTVTEDERST